MHRSLWLVLGLIIMGCADAPSSETSETAETGDECANGPLIAAHDVLAAGFCDCRTGEEYCGAAAGEREGETCCAAVGGVLVVGECKHGMCMPAKE